MGNECLILTCVRPGKSLSQICTNQSVVVPGKNMAICESRVTPGHAGPFTVQLAGGGIDQFSTAYYFYSLGRKLCDEKFSVFIEHPGLLSVPDKMDISPPVFGNCGKILPKPVTVFEPETTQFSVTVNTVNEVIFNERRINDTLEGIGFILTFSNPQPYFFSGGGLLAEFYQQGAAVEAADKQVVFIPNRCGNTHTHSQREGYLPVHLSRFRVQTIEIISSPDHNDRLTGLLDQDWGIIANLVIH